MDEKIIMQGKNHRISDIKEELKSIQDGKLDGFIKNTMKIQEAVL